ncbi:MAG: endonuclease III [bacterium]|jgi:endonuclease-3|nr:endonuclease III [Bacillota bacterium]
MDQRTKKILAILEKEYGDLKPGLTYESPFQLLIAVILSAQCTDVRVNKVTSRLFAKYKTPEDFVKLEQAELEEEIRECGLFRNKAKNIRETCAILVEKYGGQVPSAREELMSLPGVGRKSANVILSQAFGQDALAVDTHVFRVSHRLGLARGKTPLATERELQQVIPRSQWSQAHLWLIWHGRQVCRAQRPRCDECPLQEYCPAGQAEEEGA